MKKLNKQQLKERDAESAKLRGTFDDLDSAINAYHAVDALAYHDWQAVAESLKRYNDAIIDANAFAEGIASEIQEYIDSKSEAWQDGDRAMAYECWCEAWEESFDSVDLTEDNLSSGDVTDSSDIEDYAETLDSRPEEVDG